MPVIDAIEDRQEQVLSTIEETQDRLLQANRKVVAATEKLSVSKLPLDKLPLSRLPLPKLPTPNVDLPEAPKPADVVESYFGFVSKWTALNHKFASQLVEAWSPAPKPAPKAATPAAKKATAKKAAVKKTTAKKPAAKKATAAKKS